MVSRDFQSAVWARLSSRCRSAITDRGGDLRRAETRVGLYSNRAPGSYQNPPSTSLKRVSIPSQKVTRRYPCGIDRALRRRPAAGDPEEKSI